MDAFDGAMAALGQLSNQIQNVAGVASGAKIGYEKQKKLMALQNQYSIDAFNRSNARQDELLGTAPTLAVQGLKAAGLSPSDPTGNGYSSSQSPMQQDSPSAPSATIPSIPGSDFISAYAALKQAENISSVTRLNEIESNYRARKLEGEIAALNQEIDQKRETFPLIVSNLKQDVESKIASKMLTENQGLEALQRIENLKASLDGIKIDNRYNEKTLLTRISKESAELAGLLKDNRIKEAEAKLADLGIVLGHDGLTMFLSAVLNGKGDKIISELAGAIGKMVGSLPGAAGTLLKSVVDSLVGNADNIMTGAQQKINENMPKQR